MTALAFLVVIGLVFAVSWIYLANRPNPRAKIGPDGTNVRSPESFVVHHEGKGQGLDIANTALKERTENPSRELPGNQDRIQAPVPGRDLVTMDTPPSDVSKYGDQKVAPGAVPGDAEKVAGGPVPRGGGGETKSKVLTEGPVGSRPGTPEEPGSPYAKGRRVTDNHRDIETSAELLANPYPGTGRSAGRDMAASPSTNGQEPGYGLGRTAPGTTDGEGGRGSGDHANQFSRPKGRVVAFPGRAGDHTRGSVPGAGRAEGVPDGPGPEPDPDPAEEEDIDLTSPLPDPEMKHRRGHSGTAVAEPPSAKGGSALAASGSRSDLGSEQTHPSVRFNYEMAGEMAEEPEDWSALAEEIPYPISYGEDVTVALIRTPRSAYVYWDRGGPGEADLRDRLGEAEYGRSIPVLRVWENGVLRHTIDVHDHDDHWFVHEGLEPGHSYVFSYERRTSGGLFYKLSQSGPIEMPHDQPTGQTPSELLRYFGNEGRPGGTAAGSLWR